MTSPDRSLSASEVARILGVSRSHAYELIRRMPHEEFGPKCLRVRESVLEEWRQSRTMPGCASPSTAAVKSGGSAGPRTVKSTASRRGARTSEPPTCGDDDASEITRIPPIVPRTQQRSKRSAFDS